MIVVVGGQSRNIGKTSAVCEIIRATPDREWIASKISSHGHGADLRSPVVFQETAAGPGTDSGRFLEAGASQALWIRCAGGQLPEALARIPAGNWILESNMAVSVVAPDVIVFLTDSSIADCKPSGESLARSPLRMSVAEAIAWIRRQP
ncbi:MAG TPA: hypothetical protein VMZ52_01650 [Bryobacteraceae bacterium]|nr:hypothetical protein [Bryobacteraceae bacterium]